MLANQLPECTCNDSRRQRTAILISIERYTPAAFRRLAYILDETSITILRCSRRQNDSNHGMGRILQHQLFRFKLGLAIEIDGVGLVCLLVPTTLTIEHFATRQEDKWNVPGELSQIRRGLHIDAMSVLRL